MAEKSSAIGKLKHGAITGICDLWHFQYAIWYAIRCSIPSDVVRTSPVLDPERIGLGGQVTHTSRKNCRA